MALTCTGQRTAVFSRGVVELNRDEASAWRLTTLTTSRLGDVQACLDYVRHLPNVRFDTRFIAAAGVSNGGFMATPLASRYSIYTHSMNMHST